MIYGRGITILNRKARSNELGRYYDLAKIEVEKITDKTFEIFGNMGAFLRVKEQQNDSN